MDVSAVREVLVCYGNMQVVASEHCYSDVQSHLIDLDRLTDTVDVQQEEPVVQQCVRVTMMLRAKLLTTNTTRTITCYPTQVNTLSPPDRYSPCSTGRTRSPAMCQSNDDASCQTPHYTQHVLLPATLHK